MTFPAVYTNKKPKSDEKYGTKRERCSELIYKYPTQKSLTEMLMGVGGAWPQFLFTADR